MTDTRHPTVQAAALLLTLAACHTPPEMPEVAAPELPEAWQSGSADASLSASDDLPWWSTFEEPALAQAVEDTLAHNPDLAAAATRVIAAEARVRAVNGGRVPQVSAGLNGARQRSGVVGLPFPGGDVFFNQSTRFDASLAVSWEIDLWGRLGANVRAAGEELRATAADYHAARLSLAGQAAKTWLMWQEGRLQLELAREAVQLAEAQRDLVTARFRQGAATAEMVVEAESDVAAVVAAQLDSELAVEGYARALEVLAGRYPDADAEAGIAHLPELPPPPPAGLPAELLDRRPDLHAAAARVEAGRERVAATRAQLYPRLALTAQGGTTSNQLGDLLDGDFRVWSLAANLTAPLFQGGTLRAQVDEAAATARAAELGFTARVLEACAEVEAGLDTEQRVRARMAQLVRSDTQSRSALRLAEERFASGVGDAVAVYRAREDVRQSRQRLLAARRLLLVNRIDLHLALGGGFAVPQS